VRTRTHSGRLFIGTSGWSYKHWRQVVYPNRLAPANWLRFIETKFNTVEVNSSFYRLPQPGVVAAWAESAPAGFEFALKMWRGITHYNKLKNAAKNLARFLEVAEALPPHRRAPMLIQLPPNQNEDIEKLDSFLTEFHSASDGQWRLAVEFRHDSWLAPATIETLDRHHAALCVHDMRGKGAVAAPNENTTFVYVRRHGSGDARYSGRYAPEEIQADADSIRKWRAEGRDVYVYYNNDIGGHAFYNALELEEALHAPAGVLPVRHNRVGK
jgi:uncharacterized protein YecE (DUF72 family)